MNILLLGSGGREHALAWKIAQSPRLTRLHAAPGNPGIAQHATLATLRLDDHAGIATYCREHAIDLVVVGPETPLVAGLVDELAAAGIRAFGPTRAAAQLEGSKGFTKDLCRAAGIPTAEYGRFRDRVAARAYLATQPMPIVVKADGLAAGKGVVIAQTRAEAEVAVEACFAGAFGAAGAEVVIEEFLVGEEASFFALTDGETALAFGSAQDHKRVGDGDTGPNTGGMGAYSPAPVVTPVLAARVMAEIIEPTRAHLRRNGIVYRGVLFAGLMITAEGPKLIEYNCRFGDPECQVLMLRLACDIVPLLAASAGQGTLAETEIAWHEHASLAVVMAAQGYPGTPQTGTVISGLDRAMALPGVQVFHAGTRLEGERLVAGGGRVLNIAASGSTVSEARARAYAAVDLVDWRQGFFRRDIGWRAI